MAILARLSFLANIPLFEVEKPYEIYFPLPTEFPKSNCQFEDYDGVEIHDARGHEESFSLEKSGFAFTQFTSAVALSIEAFEDPSNYTTVVLPYLRETVNFVRESVKGTERVICFDWRLRRSDAETRIPRESMIDLQQDRFRSIDTARVVHTDYSINGGKARVSRQLSEAELHLYSQPEWRIRFINVWRPLVDVVEDAPLTLCDIRSLRRCDLVAADKIHEDHWEEGYYLRHHAGQKWYWLSKQRNDEVTAFVTWDSHEHEDPKCPPHASFKSPSALVGVSPRASIEVRCMLLQKDDV